LTPGYRSHYEILDIEVTASLDEVKHAFRDLSKIHHPDKNGTPDSTVLYSLILNAYQVLSNRESRAEYDHFLKLSTFIRNQYGKNLTLQIHDDGDIFRNSLSSLINMTLWEVEELVNRREFMNRKLGLFCVREFILMILTFLDKWILEPRGYKDFFMESRRLPELDPRLYIRLLGKEQRNEPRLPFTGVTDYFYDIRKRANRFISDIRQKEGSPYRGDESLVQDVREYHNLAIHYLSYLMDEGVTKFPDNPEIPGFVYSSEKYSFEL